MDGVNSEFVGLFDVPVHFSVGPGVIEAGEGEVETTECTSDAFQETRRPFASVDQWCSIEIGDEPGPTGPIVVLDGNGTLALAAGENLRYELRHRSVGEVGERLDLALDHLPVVAGWGDFEHQPIAAGGDEDEVAIDLARQSLGSGLDAPMLTDHIFSEMGGERACDCHSKILSPCGAEAPGVQKKSARSGPRAL